MANETRHTNAKDIRRINHDGFTENTSNNNSRNNDYTSRNTNKQKIRQRKVKSLVSRSDFSRFVFLIITLSVQLTRWIHVDASSGSQPTMATGRQQHLAQQQQEQHTLIGEEIEHEEELIESDARQPHIRKKRLIWITDDGRLALPPGTSLTITPTLALPFIRYPPEGFFSNMSISFPLTIDFDKLGLTDNQNPLGDFPPIFARSFGHAAGEMLGNYVARYLHYKRKRDLFDQHSVRSQSSKSGFNIKSQRIDGEDPSPTLPELPDRFKHIFHGGERVMLYIVVEDFLSTFGMDGKACLLRTICEIHSLNLNHFGVFGEMAKLFLTVTKSPFSDLIPEYVEAQKIGEGLQAPGECYPYHKDCPKSIFKKIQNHKYSEHQNEEYQEEQAEEVDDSSINEIPSHKESHFPRSLSM